MNKVIFVGFETEQKAYEGARALHDMHSDGTLTLYNDAVVVKEPGGAVAVRRAPDSEPVGAFGGMITGGLIGLLGGPVGAAVGLGTGTSCPPSAQADQPLLGRTVRTRAMNP